MLIVGRNHQQQHNSHIFLPNRQGTTLVSNEIIVNFEDTPILCTKTEIDNLTLNLVAWGGFGDIFELGLILQNGI